MGKYCLIGKKLGHSFSAVIHGKLGLDYVLNELEDEQALARFVRDNPYDGYNVTIPYKQAIMPLLDGLDASAVEANAVNTVIKRGGKSYGFNTDLQGMAYGLSEAQIPLCGEKVMILGSGGTSAMAVALAKRSGADDITVVSRSGQTNYVNCYEKRDTTVIINCTPVGMYPNNLVSPIDIGGFANVKGVFDAVYNPMQTELVRCARLRKINAANGLSMLVSQAVYAENIFLGGEVLDVKRATSDFVNAIKKDKFNLVLVGMPSSGKSTVGAALADIMQREFVDLDCVVEAKADMSIAEIFEAEGEYGFRQREKEAVKLYSRGFSRVIATGGGAVLSEENRTELKQNSYVCWLKRPLELAETVGRPLSKDLDTLKSMEILRYPLYNEIADFAVDNVGDAQDVANKIKDSFYANFSDKRG